MKLLNRYLSQIGRLLPAKDKDDTIAELKSLLLENYDVLLDQGLSETDAMYKAIQDYGSPRDVANKYKNERPLLSKEIEPLVFLIMKIVSITLPGSLVLVTMIEFLTSGNNGNTMDLLLTIAYSIPSIITTLLSTLAFIYLVFIIIDHKLSLKFQLPERKFDPSYLPIIPSDAYKVSRFEIIFNMIGAILFLYLFNLEPGLIAITFEGTSERLLNANFERILPILNVSVFISIGYNIAFMVKGARTRVTASIEFFQTILAGIILILLGSGNIFNSVLIEGYQIEFVPTIFKVVSIIGAVVTFIGAVVKYIKILISTNED